MTTPTPVAGAATLVAVIVGAMPVQAPRAPTDPRAIKAAWIDAVSAHLPGQLDASALTIARWPPETMSIVIDHATGSDVAVLAKGLVLHTDIAIAERNAGTAGPARGARNLMLLDGTAVGPIGRSPHWTLARRLADALAEQPKGAPIARTWYRAITAAQQHWGELGPNRTLLQGAAALFPDDPVLALYDGTLHQGQADPRLQRYLSGSGGHPGQSPIGSADEELGRAEQAFRRALAIDPTLVEARIRLAHVVGDRGKADEASALTREALAAALPAFLDYYGAMILGRNEARLGHAGEARAAFARAASHYPGDQAAQVALSQVGLVEGRASEGLDAVVTALGHGAPADETGPWLSYFRRHEPDAASRLDDLRRSVK
jgi:tetratricopeptide (TPR) repeat protein